MTAAGIIWIVLAPYLTGLGIARSERTRLVMARHLRVWTSLGWLALASVLAGAFLVGGHAGALLMVAAAPLVGLAFWSSSPGGGDDGPPAPAPDDPLPSGDTIDWDDLLRWLEDEARDRERIPV